MKTKRFWRTRLRAIMDEIHPGSAESPGDIEQSAEAMLAEVTREILLKSAGCARRQQKARVLRFARPERRVPQAPRPRLDTAYACAAACLVVLFGTGLLLGLTSPIQKSDRLRAISLQPSGHIEIKTNGSSLWDASDAPKRLLPIPDELTKKIRRLNSAQVRKAAARGPSNDARFKAALAGPTLAASQRVAAPDSEKNPGTRAAGSALSHPEPSAGWSQPERNRFGEPSHRAVAVDDGLVAEISLTLGCPVDQSRISQMLCMERLIAEHQNNSQQNTAMGVMAFNRTVNGSGPSRRRQ